MGFTKLGLGLRLFFELLLCSSQFYIHRIFGFFIFLFLFLKRCYLIRKKPRKRMSHSSVHKRRKERAPLPHLIAKGLFFSGPPFYFLLLNAFLSRFALRHASRRTYKTPLKTLLLITLVILQFQNCFLWKRPRRYLRLSSHNK